MMDAAPLYLVAQTNGGMGPGGDSVRSIHPSIFAVHILSCADPHWLSPDLGSLSASTGALGFLGDLDVRE
jgi:hypothetical protein